MTVIKQYELKPVKEQVIEVPSGCGILQVAIISNKIVLWITATELFSTVPIEKITIFMRRTDEAFKEPGTYINTIELNSIIWHVFLKM